MTRYMSTNIFGKEEYYCNTCNKDLSKKEIDQWCCIHCNDQVEIDAGLSHTIMRKLPEDVTKDDIYVFPSGEFHEIYEVGKKKGEIYYNIKGYRQHPQYSNEWVNCKYQ
ncbi:hypothetical protein [Mesobacillus foraminis]|uniref:Uncharacterized protein n=1 Tax=Mesobacillus foraminis TaxID=279826 RepID=A0A4R2BGH9_9BACI|nr:hypothetical protein [Mesobacillus foraminis]TCN25482.1 hypothetical protein EV146_105139 [Mesobacillus foraminis]